MVYAIIFVGAYLIGSVPFGFLIGKIYGIDIRTVGSGNIGATNVTRSVGPVAGKICFFLDFFKGLVPVLLAAHFAAPGLPALTAGIASIVGHMFPVYLKFKGGKGISTAAGVGLALAPWALLTAFAVWAAVFFASRYVSLASIAAAVALPAAATVYQIFHIGRPIAAATLVFFYLVGALGILRHRENIRRLLNGTESRFEKKKA